MAADKRARLTKFEDEFMGEHLGIFEKILKHLRAVWVLVFNGMPDEDMKRESHWHLEEAGRAARRGQQMTYDELKRRKRAARKR